MDLLEPSLSGVEATLNGSHQLGVQKTGMNNNTSTTNMNTQSSSMQQIQNPGMRSCAGCGGRICDRFLLHAVDRYWHTGCLKCSCCQAQLGELGSSCFAKGGMILCKNDYIRLFGSSGTCSTCGLSIPASEFVMKAQGNVYHLKCFTCMSCHSQLVPGDRFGLINGSLFCEQDYPKVLKSSHVSIGRGHKVTKMRNTVF